MTAVLAGGVGLPEKQAGVVAGGASVGVVGASSIMMSVMEKKCGRVLCVAMVLLAIA